MADGTIRFLPMVLSDEGAIIVQKHKGRWEMRKKYTAITGLDVQQNSISLVTALLSGSVWAKRSNRCCFKKTLVDDFMPISMG